MKKFADGIFTYYINGFDQKTEFIKLNTLGWMTVNLYGNGPIGIARVTPQAGYALVYSYYHLKDHLGSTRVTIDGDAYLKGYDDYFPFGMVMDNRSASIGNPDARYKFTSKERDVETGYDYFGARYYDSRIGRWLTMDPVAEKYPGWSPYNYVADNPIKLFDPNGEGWWDAVKGYGSGLWNGVRNNVVGLVTSPWTTLQLAAAYTNDPSGTIFGASLGFQQTFQEKYSTLTSMSPSNDFPRSELIGEVAVDVAAILATARASQFTTVRHYTDNMSRELISNSGYLREGSYVTKPRMIPGQAIATQIEDLLEIRSGAGKNFIDFKVKKKDLTIPEAGPETSGGKYQRQIKKNITIDRKKFKRTENEH